MYDGQGKIFSRNAEYWRQIQSMNLLEHWKNTKAKVLVLFGESDFQAFSLADHQQIVRTVNYYSPGNALLLSFPQTDHYFAKSGTMQEAYDKFVNQQYLELFDAYNFEVGSSVLAWSLEVIGTRPTK
jgi:precorrin-6x reductase